MLDRIKTKKNFNIAKSIPSSLLLSLIIMLFLCNWFLGKTNGYDFYRIKLLIAILGVATIVLLALSERWNTAAGNDRDSRIPDEGDRFFSLSPDMLCVVGFDGCFKRINPAAEKILGYSPAEMVGKLFIEFVHPDDREATLKEAESIAAGNNTVGLENRWRCRNESYKWIAWTVSPCCEEELIYGIGREITDRKEIEAALLESNILFKNVIESTGDSIFVKDTQSRYLLLNSTAASIIGLPKSEIIGKKDAELFPLEITDMLVENDRRIWQSGIEETLEEVVKDSEGNILTFLSTKSPLRDRAGNITGVVGVARDISDRKQAEIALQQSEEKYRCLTEGTSQIIWDTNANGEVVTEQPGWSAFTGRTYEEMKGWKWLNDIHPDDREETARIWFQAVTNRTIYKIEHRLRK